MATSIIQYQKIIVAVDFSESSKNVVTRALHMAQQNSASLILLHVVEYLSPLSFGDEIIPSPDWLVIEEQLFRQAEKSLATLAEEMKLNDATRLISKGSANDVIVETARQQGANLIILGAHGRLGLQRLLGSTASSVVRHAPCDVLAVRLQ